MRPKIVLVILLLAVGLLGLVALVSRNLHPRSTSPTSTPVASGNVSPAATVSSNLVSPPASNPPPVVAAVKAGTNDAAAHAAYVERRIEELDALAMNNDAQSRDTILSELKNNPDKQIRAAALEAAIQFDDRSVVPPMQEIAAQTQDPEEKAAILKAIDYINLPSLTEYRAAHPRTPGSVPKGTAPRRRPSPNSGQ
jgi:hypothetical protein